LTKVNNVWTMNAGSVFNTGGDTRVCARLLTVQVSMAVTKPANTLAGPLVPNYADGVLAWTGGSVSRQSRAAPQWMRVENRVGRWSGWVAIK
jgi:hypothetical protein